MQDKRRAVQLLISVSVTTRVPGVVADVEPGCVKGAAGTTGVYGGGGLYPPPTALPPLVFVLALPLPPWPTAAAGTPKLDDTKADADVDRGLCRGACRRRVGRPSMETLFRITSACDSDSSSAMFAVVCWGSARIVVWAMRRLSLCLCAGQGQGREGEVLCSSLGF